MINSERVKQARELRGLTQTELASRIGVTQAAIAQIEGGRTQPADTLIEAIALQTGFPTTFFRQVSAVDFPLGSLLFRARSSMPTRDRSLVHRYGQIMFELAGYLAARVRAPAIRLPRLTDEDPVEAARITRAALSLSPDTPIPQVIRTLEQSGVLFFVLPTRLQGGDAYSVWAGMHKQRAIIVIFGDAPGDRLRFTIAHELGHLAMHYPPQGNIKDLDAEAHRFAGEFLLPEAAMRQELTPPITLTSLAALKRRWGVSIQALIEQSFTLEIITKRQRTYLYEQISGRGWKTKEPPNLDVPVEKPRALRKMAEVLYGDPIDYAQLAADTNLSVQFVRQVIETQASKADLGRKSEGEVHEEPPLSTGKVLSFSNKRNAQ